MRHRALPVNLAAVANANDSNDLLGVVDFVNDAVIAEANTPTFSVGQFIAPDRSGVLLQC
jgi:hypothetical protein